MAELSPAKLECQIYGEVDILRREETDVVTYKDFLFGMLFSKMISNVLTASRDSLTRTRREPITRCPF
jgi:hypothetical protein